MLYIKRRDYRVIRFIENFNCATTSQIHRLFFGDVTLRACQDRLALLAGWNHLTRERESAYTDYLYYIGKRPAQIAHDLARVDAYISLDAHFQIAEFVPEYQIDDVRADAYFTVYQNGFNVPFFLEVQISPNFRQEKYEKLYMSGAWVDKWPEFPSVLVLSDNKIRLHSENVRFIQLPLKGGDFNALLLRDAGSDVCAWHG